MARHLLAALLLFVGFAASAEDGFRRLIEFGAVPADPATIRLKEAVAAALKRSDGFEMSAGLKPGTLVISFPKPVEVRSHMGRAEYLYRVEFSAVNGRPFERGFGSCWADQIQSCVFNVVQLANRVAPRL